MLSVEMRKPISLWSRTIYAFFGSVLVVGVFMVLDMVFSFGIGDFIFSPMFFVPVFVIAYLVTPYIAHRVKLD
jgi:hypothetical protein